MHPKFLIDRWNLLTAIPPKQKQKKTWLCSIKKLHRFRHFFPEFVTLQPCIFLPWWSAESTTATAPWSLCWVINNLQIQPKDANYYRSRDSAMGRSASNFSVRAAGRGRWCDHHNRYNERRPRNKRTEELSSANYKGVLTSTPLNNSLLLTYNFLKITSMHFECASKHPHLKFCLNSMDHLCSYLRQLLRLSAGFILGVIRAQHNSYFILEGYF